MLESIISLEMKFYEVTGAERQLRSMQASWKRFLVHLLGTQLPAEFSTQHISLIHVTFVCKDKQIRSILPINHWMREACTKWKTKLVAESATFWQKDPSKVNDEGDTCYNNPMFKSDATSFQAGTMTVSILWENNTKHKLIVGLQVAYQLRCTAYMPRNKDKPVKCQLLLPTKHKLYVSGRGTIHTNCTGNCMAARVWVTTNLIMTVFHTLSIINMLICLCTR